MSSVIQQWCSIIIKNKEICNRWCSANELYDNFNKYNPNQIIEALSYQSFLKQLNIIQNHSIYNIFKEMKREYGNIREYNYYFIYDNYNSRSKQSLTRSSKIDSPISPMIDHSPSTSDEQYIPVTPIETRPNGNNSTISHVSKMSMQHIRPLEVNNNISVPIQNLAPRNSHCTINHLYPTLNQYGVPTDLSVPANMSTIQAILRDIQNLNKSFDLSFPTLNNNIIKPFFIPSSLASRKAFNHWDKGNKGVSAIMSYISNGICHKTTGDPIAIEFLFGKLSDSYPKSFHNHANLIGYDKPIRMNVIETAAVLSEVGVGDKKILKTLQKHIKAKYNGREIFCPRRDLNSLTDRLPQIICNNTLFEKESGLKKESVGVAYIDSVEAIRLDMDRYIQSKMKSTNIWDTAFSNIPLFSTNTPMQIDGTYLMIGTDHGQGTAQFLMRTLLGPSSSRRVKNRPDYNTRDINYATIKCRKDPYEILKLTMSETNKCIRHLNTHKLIALSGQSPIVRCLFIDVKCVQYSIDGHKFNCFWSWNRRDLSNT